MIAEKVVNKEKASKGPAKFAKASSQRDNLEVKKVHHQTVSTQQIENPPSQEGMHTGRFIGDENLWMQSKQEVGEEQYDEQHNFSIDRATLIEDYETAGPSRKRTRGATGCKKIHIRSVADRKLVTFNVHGQPIGPDEATVKELSLFLGTLARNSVTCPLIHTSWKKLPMEKKISMWKYVNLKYILPPNAKTWVLSDISNSWRCYKSRVKAKHFTKYQNDEERWKNRPIKIPGDHFKSLLKYWKSKEVKETSDRNIRNRSQLKYMHRAGTTSFAVTRQVLKEKNENQEEPTRVQLFIETHKSKKGNKSNEETDNLILQLEEISEHPEQNPEDVFAMTFGKENPGRLRTYGQGVTCSSLKKQRQIEDLERIHKKEIESMKKRMDAHTDDVASKFHVIMMTLKKSNPSLVIEPNILAPLLGESSYNKENMVNYERGDSSFAADGSTMNELNHPHDLSCYFL